MLTWDDLAARALARQFPDVPGRDAVSVRRALELIGPIQAQTARAPFLALAARMPGVTLETISTAYDEHRIVRGSNIRGTVHTSTPEDSPLLEVATRLGQRSLWQRTLKLRRTTLEDVWDGIEEFARDEWRTPAELSTHLVAWLQRHDPDAGANLDNEAGRYFGFGHGGLIRRPLRGGWQGQGAPGYRSAAAVLGDRRAVLADQDGSIDALVRRHISSHGPSSRQDLAWWAGVGLRVVDASLDRLADELDADPGPDGRIYHDLPGTPPPRVPDGVRLLPEFDALFCGYEPKGAGPCRHPGAPCPALDQQQRAGPGPAPRRRPGHRAVAAPGKRHPASLRGHLVRRHASAHQGRAGRAGECCRVGVRHHRDGAERHPRLSSQPTAPGSRR